MILNYSLQNNELRLIIILEYKTRQMTFLEGKSLQQ